MTYDIGYYQNVTPSNLLFYTKESCYNNTSLFCTEVYDSDGMLLDCTVHYIGNWEELEALHNAVVSEWVAE